MMTHYAKFKKIAAIFIVVFTLNKISAQCITPSLVMASPATLCSGSTTSLNAISVGSSINWYTVPVGGVALGSSISGANFTINPLVSNTFYAEAYQPGGIQTFSYTGSVQTVTIQAGVSQITVDARGAQGGTDASSAPGGLGGKVTCVYTVVPGQVLYIYVGGVGGNTGGAGGFNGGGFGGSTGGAGGGASDIRIGGITLSDRVIVAGAGGGAGANCNTNTEYGGFGGGLTAGAGWECGIQDFNIVGQGGSQVAGGLGALGYPVPSGSLGIGGSSAFTIWCGGGGGGYFGGGVGAYGGGGGGSSYTGPGALSVVHTSSFQPGNGQISITGLGIGCVNPIRVGIAVTVNSSPTITISGPTAVCAGNTISLTANGANTYTWNNGALTQLVILTPTANTTYSIIGTSISGCTGTISQMVSVVAGPTLSINGPTNIICPSNAAFLTANTADSYTWSTGANTSIIATFPNVTTTYTVSGTLNLTGCVISAVKTVSVFPNNLQVAGAGSICVGQNIVLAANGGISYTWQPGNLNGFQITVAPNISTVYTVVANTIDGCVFSLTTAVQVIVCTNVNTNYATSALINLYPNPTSGEFTLEQKNDFNKIVEVSDLTGRIVLSTTFSKDKILINLNHLDNGIYNLKIQSNNEVKVIKLIKQ